MILPHAQRAAEKAIHNATEAARLAEVEARRRGSWLEQHKSARDRMLFDEEGQRWRPSCLESAPPTVEAVSGQFERRHPHLYDAAARWRPPTWLPKPPPPREMPSFMRRENSVISHKTMALMRRVPSTEPPRGHRRVSWSVTGQGVE